MTWVDFQTVRENLDALVVLGHYGFDVKQNGQDQVKICCPFHDDKTPSCGLNTKKRVFHCFSCGEKGNILDFFAKMEGFDDRVAIVEGYWSVLRLHAAGVPVVACFGDSLSPEQVDLLVEAGFTRALLIFDGDEGGRNARQSVAKRPCADNAIAWPAGGTS